jgi:hypothetical protein
LQTELAKSLKHEVDLLSPQKQKQQRVEQELKQEIS